ncbi:YHYH domain-containing protein [Psychrobacter sp. TAE2020]|uniref:YHYH domain-containing protein n=1 Tax=Psychrobacter sp. TAE2020 TaxID=2846762 RepID=UPI002B4A1524|nr:YHYH domain-containing protein [Psychrobacter sp. TAE2020]
MWFFIILLIASSMLESEVNFNIKGSIVMKKIMVVLLTLTFATSAFATSGRTNSSGCHNSKTQGYHCH